MFLLNFKTRMFLLLLTVLICQVSHQLSAVPTNGYFGSKPLLMLSGSTNTKTTCSLPFSNSFYDLDTLGGFWMVSTLSFPTAFKLQTVEGVA